MDPILRLLVRAANVDHVDDNEPLPADIAAQDKGPGIIVTILCLTSITTLFVIARLYTRARVLRAAHLDDWLIVVSMACTWVAAGFSVVANLKGAGRHVRALTQQQLHDAIFFVMTGFVPSLLSFAFPKLAIVALLTRLMNPSRIHKRFLWALAGSCFLVLCTNIFVEFAQCNPVSALWDKSIKKTDKSCWDPRVNLYTAYFAGGKKLAYESKPRAVSAWLSRGTTDTSAPKPTPLSSTCTLPSTQPSFSSGFKACHGGRKQR